MKTFSRISILIFTVLLVFACKNKNPADEDFFVGTYEGSIGYTNSDGEKESHNDGKVTVVKTGKQDTYNFRFSDGIDNLQGVEFKREGDKRLINLDFEDGAQFIQIDEKSLKMLYSKDSQTWEADAKRD